MNGPAIVSSDLKRDGCPVNEHRRSVLIQLGSVALRAVDPLSTSGARIR